MNRTILIIIGLACAVISAVGIMHYNNPRVKEEGICTLYANIDKQSSILPPAAREEGIDSTTVSILKQYVGLKSGITQPEYYLFSRNEEMSQFIFRKEDERKRMIPHPYLFRIDFEKEMCLLVFIGETKTDGLFAEVIDTNEKVIFRIAYPSYQTLETYYLNTLTGVKTKVVELEIKGPPMATPFGYFVLPKTSKKIVIERNQPRKKGEQNWQAVKEFMPK